MSIKIENLYHIYSPGGPLEKIALNNINIEICEGQLLGIAGHTGSGKSTLVQHLNGLLKPTRGKISVDGIDLTLKKTDFREVRKKVGLVFQYPEHQLFEETVYKDIAFGPRNLGTREEDIAAIVQDSMQKVGLEYEYFKDLNPFQLSGGQMRRVAIAGVLAVQPKILVLDEPTAGLDPMGKKELLALIQELHQEKKITIVLVSHSMEDLARVSEKIIVLDKGEIAINGSPSEVFTQAEKLKSIGLGTPLITELMIQLNKRGMNVREDITTVSEGVKEIKKLARGFDKC